MNWRVALVFRAGVVPFDKQALAFLLGEERLQVVTRVRILGDCVQGSGVVAGDGFDLFARQCLSRAGEGETDLRVAGVEIEISRKSKLCSTEIICVDHLDPIRLLEILIEVKTDEIETRVK